MLFICASISIIHCIQKDEFVKLTKIANPDFLRKKAAIAYFKFQSKRKKGAF
jgi:hypothetical protein